MDSGIGILILLALAIPVLAIAGFVMALTTRGRIETLERRVATLEGALARQAQQVPPPAAPAAATTEGATVAAEAPATPATPSVSTPSPPRQSVPPATAKAPPRPQAAPKRSLEERLGARWSVIVGGLALALGGVFLVRYSIEQGLIGPAARVTLGALFAGGLLALGERMRRSEAAVEKPRRAIDIPAVVTSAGAVSAFATVYAAYALYGFIGPALGFVLLGAVAVATLLAAALHGPILGALGLIGAYGVPLLVSSDEPNLVALLLYLLAPTAAAFAVARLRRWPALAIAAGAGAFAWGALATIGIAGPGDAGVLLVYAAACTGLAAFLHVGLSRSYAPPARPPVISNVLIGLFGLLAVTTPALDGFGAAALFGLGLLVAVNLGLATLIAGLAPAAPIAVGIAALAALSFDDTALRAVAETTSFPVPGAPAAETAGTASFLGFAGSLGLLFLLAGALAARTRAAVPGWHAGLLAAAATAGPLALVAVAYWQVAAFAPDLRFALLAVLLAGCFAALTEDAARRERAGAGGPMATAAFATGAAAALGLALAMAMREGALTVALAFLAASLGFVATARPIRALGWLAVAAVGLVLLRIVIDPRIVGDALSTTPLFNALLWGYGAPAVAFWVGSRLFDKAGQAWPAQVLEAAALVFALLLGFTQARHFAHGGDLAGSGVRLVEAGLDATVAFALAAVAGRLGLKRASPVLAYAVLAASGLGLLVTVLGLLLRANPLFTGDPVGDGIVFNDLMLGYLLPAIAAAAALRFAGDGRPAWFRRGVGAAALVLALAWVSLMVRRVFAGPFLDGPITGDGEWYAYSVVWLAFGLALLAAGVVRGSRMVRLASAAVVTAVVLKVFLFDMAGLGGVWRALSFMGLGAVLLGIGLVYQRLLLPRERA